MGPLTQRVVHISFSDMSGGAARGMYWLHRSLASVGVDSQVLCLRKETPDPSVHLPSSRCASALSKIAPRINAYISRALAPGQEDGFSANLIGVPIRGEVRRLDPTVTHLHWVARATLLSWQLARLRRPVVWTIRDMWPLTGGCHYDVGCGRFMVGCGCCPMLNSNKEQDLSRWMFNAREKAIGEGQLYLVALSNWLAQQIGRSPLLSSLPLWVIPPGIDTSEFRPYPRHTCRSEFNFPQDAHVVGFASMGGALDKRKGWSELSAALSLLSAQGQRRMVLASVGDSRALSPVSGVPTFWIPKISDDSSLAKLYSACDVVAVPSRQEAFGKVAIEAMSCGTPVVGFRGTGVEDAIYHQRTGYLADAGSIEQLSYGISWVLADPTRRAELGAAARQRVESRFSLHAQAAAYLALYEQATGVSWNLRR